MVRVLAVADETEESLWRLEVRRLAPDLVVGCGDLPWDYLEYLSSTLDVPVVFVPGNHDPEIERVQRSWGGLALRDGLPTDDPRPRGCINADQQVVDVAGLRIAGLGGCVRYRPGPHQYTQREYARRARRLAVRFRRQRRRDGRGLDLLLTHAPPRGLGDREDRPHQGIQTLHTLVPALRPSFLLHGHIHPYGEKMVDRELAGVPVYNVVPHRLVEVGE